MAPSREKRKNERGYISKLLRQVQQHISTVYVLTVQALHEAHNEIMYEIIYYIDKD